MRRLATRLAPAMLALLVAIGLGSATQVAAVDQASVELAELATPCLVADAAAVAADTAQPCDQLESFYATRALADHAELLDLRAAPPKPVTARAAEAAHGTTLEHGLPLPPTRAVHTRDPIPKAI